MPRFAWIRGASTFARVLAKRATGAHDDDIVRQYHSRARGGARHALTAVDRLIRRAITPFVITVGLALAVLIAITHSEWAIYALLAFLPIGWFLVFALVTKSPEELPSVHALLRTFDRQVDHAKQHFANDPKTIDDQVRHAFVRMHDQVQVLLQHKKIRMSQIRREVLRFHSPNEPMGNRWRPPTLSEMGYVVAAAAKFSPGAPVLALYKFSGEQRSRDGTVAETYTIVKEGSANTFSDTFAAKIQSPFKVSLMVSDDVRATLAPRGEITSRAPVDADHNVTYILSLLGPITPATAPVLLSNLRAMRGLGEDREPPPLSCAVLHARLRSMFTEVDSHSESSLRTTRAALRQAPLLAVAALADIERAHDDNHARLRSGLDAIADILVPAPNPAQAAILLALQRLALPLQQLTLLGDEEQLNHPGLIYLEARGVEADSEYLKRLAQLIKPTVPLLLMTTNLSLDEFQSRLRGYVELQPGPAHLAILATLDQALREGKLKLNTVRGSAPVMVKTLIGELGSKTLIISANPLLTDMDGIENPVACVLWTLSSHALVMTGAQTQSVLSLMGQIAAGLHEAGAHLQSGDGARMM